VHEYIKDVCFIFASCLLSRVIGVFTQLIIRRTAGKRMQRRPCLNIALFHLRYWISETKS